MMPINQISFNGRYGTTRDDLRKMQNSYTPAINKLTGELNSIGFTESLNCNLNFYMSTEQARRKFLVLPNNVEIVLKGEAEVGRNKEGELVIKPPRLIVSKESIKACGIGDDVSISMPIGEDTVELKAKDGFALSAIPMENKRTGPNDVLNWLDKLQEVFGIEKIIKFEDIKK